MDREPGGIVIQKKFRPAWTQWDQRTIRKVVRIHKRRARRIYKQYLKTGSNHDFLRSQVILGQWDFD